MPSEMVAFLSSTRGTEVSKSILLILRALYKKNIWYYRILSKAFGKTSNQAQLTNDKQAMLQV